MQLGFDIDWGGLVGNAVKAVGAISAARNTLTLQRTQQAAVLRAQEAELQMMKLRQAQAAPPPGYTQIMPVRAAPRQDALPSWVIPAAVGVGVLFLMRK